MQIDGCRILAVLVRVFPALEKEVALFLRARLH